MGLKTLEPIRPPVDEVGLKLLWKPATYERINVHNIETNQTEELQLQRINRGISVPLIKTTHRDLHDFFVLNGQNFTLNYVKDVVKETKEMFDVNGWLNCSLNSYCYHGKELMSFANQQEKILIFKRDNDFPMKIKSNLLNAYWRIRHLPWRCIRRVVRFEEA